MSYCSCLVQGLMSSKWLCSKPEILDLHFSPSPVLKLCFCFVNQLHTLSKIDGDKIIYSHTEY